MGNFSPEKVEPLLQEVASAAGMISKNCSKKDETSAQ
jgi:hypothetical protein